MTSKRRVPYVVFYGPGVQATLSLWVWFMSRHWHTYRTNIRNWIMNDMIPTEWLTLLLLVSQSVSQTVTCCHSMTVTSLSITNFILF